MILPDSSERLRRDNDAGKREAVMERDFRDCQALAFVRVTAAAAWRGIGNVDFYWHGGIQHDCALESLITYREQIIS